MLCSPLKDNSNMKLCVLRYNQIIDRSMQEEHHVNTFDQNLMINQIEPLKHIHEAHSNSIESLAVHPSQTAFATGSHDHHLKLWDLEKFKETRTLDQHKEGVWTLDYSLDGNLLVSGGPDKSVLLWDHKKGSPSIRINGHKDKVYCARFNETSKLLGTCGEQGELFVWDLAKPNQPLAKIQKSNLILYDFRWSGNQEAFFVTTLGSELLAYNSKTFAQLSSDVVTPGEQISKCETVQANFQRINNRVFCGTSRGVIAWYDFQNSKLTKEVEFSAHLDSVRTINYHPQRRVLMTTARDGSVKIWDAASDDAQPTILGNLVLHCENVPAAAFVNNELVITGSWDQKLALWNVKDLIK